MKNLGTNKSGIKNRPVNFISVFNLLSKPSLLAGFLGSSRQVKPVTKHMKTAQRYSSISTKLFRLFQNKVTKIWATSLPVDSVQN